MWKTSQQSSAKWDIIIELWEEVVYDFYSRSYIKISYQHATQQILC